MSTQTWAITDYGAMGDGVADDTSALHIACNTAVKANGGMVLIPDGTYRLATNLTIPETVTLWFLGTAMLLIETGITLTLHGPIQASLTQIFSGTGTIAGCERMPLRYPHWFSPTLTLPSTSVSLLTPPSTLQTVAPSHSWIANNTAVLTLTDQTTQLTAQTATLNAATLLLTGNVLTSSTGALQVPQGTTAQQPTGNTGLIRYNTTLSHFEGYGAQWDTLLTASAPLTNLTSTVTLTGSLTVNGTLAVSNTTTLTGNLIAADITSHTLTIMATTNLNTVTANTLRLSGPSVIVTPNAFGYSTGAGSSVLQSTSRTTPVQIDTPTGAITLYSTAASPAPTWTTFTMQNALIAPSDTILVTQRTGTDAYQIFVTNVTTGFCNITFATTGGTTTESPIFNFSVVKGSTS